MFDTISSIFANPNAPIGVLLLIAGVGMGFWWGSEVTATRIGKDLSSLGRMRLGDHLFFGQYIGYAPDIADDIDDDEDGDGSIKTVDDLARKTGEQKCFHR